MWVIQVGREKTKKTLRENVFSVGQCGSQEKTGCMEDDVTHSYVLKKKKNYSIDEKVFLTLFPSFSPAFFVQSKTEGLEVLWVLLS